MKHPMPSRVIYINLGESGSWAEDCIRNDDTVKLGFSKTNHTQCKQGDWAAVRKAFLKHHDASKATRQTNEVKAFYTSDASVLWITIHDGFVWWCFSEPKIKLLEDGHKTRPVIEHWRNKTASGADLRLEEVDECLTKKRFYRGTLLYLKGSEENSAIQTILGYSKLDGKHSGELTDLATKKEDGGYFSPANLKDERERCLREIVERRGKAAFRNKLIAAYRGRCAVSRCDAVAALESAHIVPYQGPATDKVPNGLLLRGDIHTLFDLDLLGIHPNSRTVHLNSMLKKTSYKKLQGVKLLEPENSANRPNTEALEKRWAQFKNG